MLVKPSQLWSKLIKLGQTRFKLVLFGTGHYTHTHTEQDLINKLFKYISLSRNFVIEVYHALFLHQKLKFEITVISFNSRLEGRNDKD